MITNRQAHEEAAQQPLAENFFSVNGIDPKAPFTGGVFTEVIKERKRQDEKWGGTSHDDEHTSDDWQTYIFERITEDFHHNKSYRQRMIEVAALAIAAVQSFDRRAYAGLPNTNGQEIK